MYKDYNIERPTPATTQEIPELLQRTQDLIINLDTEYTAFPILPTPPLGLSAEVPDQAILSRTLQQNRGLSYQWLAVNAQTGLAESGIAYPVGLERLTLGDIIMHAGESAGIDAARLRPQGKNKTPLRVMVCWHWGSAEVGMMKDRLDIMAKEEVVDIGGSVITLKPFLHTFQVDDSGHYGLALVSFRDTRCLLDTSTKLEALGELLGTPKVDIEPYTKDRMDLLLKGDKALFEHYALTDTEIVWQWIRNTAKTQVEVLNVTHDLEPTTGSASAAGLKQFLGEDYKESFCVRYNHRKGEWTPQTRRALDESFPTQAFMGGMNQSYRLGRVEGTILDLDLDGAYAGALGILPGIDWDRAAICDIRDPWKLTDLMTFTAVHFTFPEDTAYPCLPVSTEHGLIYPLSNVGDKQPTVVTGPELHEALLMGATIKVWAARKFTPKGLLTAEYVKYLVEQRRQFPKKDPRNLAAKLAINSLYGKFGQGLANRYTNDEIFTIGEIDEGKKMRRSAITLPHAAATITGLIRSVLNVLVLEGSKVGEVLSSTTDGMMIRLNEGMTKEAAFAAIVEAASSHPSVKLLAEGRGNLGLVPGAWLEVKYEGTQASTIKTRMNWIGTDEGTVHEARVGFGKDQGAEGYIPFTALENIAQARQKAYYTAHGLNRIGDVVENRANDITSFVECKRVNLCPDWKRHFAGDGTSIPFASMAEYWRYRRVVDSLADDAWPERVEFAVSQRFTSSKMITKAVRRDVMHRIALGHEGYRLPKGMTYKKVCELLEANPRALSNLRLERWVDSGMPTDDPEAKRIQALLGLW